MSKLTYLVALAVLAVALFTGQLWKAKAGADPATLKPLAGEISVEKAVRSCEAFCRKVRVYVPKSVPRVSRSKRDGKLSRVYGVQYPGQATFSVDAKTGVVTTYLNSSRLWARSSNRPSASYGDDVKARLRMKELAKSLGVTGKHRLTSFLFRSASSYGGIPSTDDAARASGRYETTPYGYRMRTPCDAYEVVFDASDGALVEFYRVGPRPYAIESREANLKVNEAKSAAKPTAVKYSVGRRRKSDGWLAGGRLAPAKPTTLEYVVPNGVFGGPEYAAKPERLRLAWVVRYPRDEEIWIDAGDGKVLGGVYATRRR